MSEISTNFTPIITAAIAGGSAIITAVSTALINKSTTKATSKTLESRLDAVERNIETNATKHTELDPNGITIKWLEAKFQCITDLLNLHINDKNVHSH